ncbi:MAG TPA: GlsB/YeaQ/YmgE family stress response membrane protein [Actinomycetota bacterium]|nr:GlsB/YeaQ/YmgE family stress response membrane protein [Actinomycetota bacterium]
MYLILALLAIALASGWIAQLIVGRSHGKTDWTQALIAGFIGSFVGGLLASLIAGDGLRFRPSGLIGSIFGAVIVTAVWGLIRGRQAA